MVQHSRRTLLGILALYLLLAVVATYPLVLQPGDHVCGFGQEGRIPSATPPLNIWAMATVLHHLPWDPLHLFEGTAFYPYTHTLAFSEHLFVPALLAWPVVLLTGNLVLAYNFILFLELATAGLGMYLLAREITEDDLASFAAGLLYAFHTWNINELVRSQITANQWFPFVLLALVRFFAKPSARGAALVGVAYLLQSLSCMYWALYLPFLVAAAVLYLWCRRRNSWRVLLPLALALGVGVALTGLFAIPYVDTARSLGFERPPPPSVPIDRYLDVLPQNLLYAGLLGTALRNQNAAHFLGFAAMGLALLGLLDRRAGAERAVSLQPLLAALVVAGFALSLGPEVRLGDTVLGPGPYALVRRFVPGFRNVRYPERISILLILGLAPLVAIGLARLRPRLGRLGAVLVCGFLFLEHLSIPQPLSLLPSGAAIPSVYRWLGAQADVRVVAQVPAGAYFMERADALPMYFSTVHWKRTVEGYTSYFAPTYNFIKWRLYHFPDPESVAFLARFGVDTVVVEPAEGQPPTWARADPRWDLASFPEGHVALRLKEIRGQGYPPPRPEAGGLAEVDRADWQVQASWPQPERAIDGDPATVWATGRAQVAGDFYRIRFRGPVDVARVSLALRTPLRPQSCEFPMHFRVLGKEEKGDEWQEIPFDVGATYDRLFASLLHRPKEATLDVDIAPRTLRLLQVEITQTDRFWMPWTLPEIRVYRSVSR